MSSASNPYRPLTNWEKGVLLRLLEPAFPGRDILRQQVNRVLGAKIDENGSLDLHCAEWPPAPVERRIPTEGEALDKDGTTIHYLLHVVDGKLKELEVYKDDSSNVLCMPSPSGIDVITG